MYSRGVFEGSLKGRSGAVGLEWSGEAFTFAQVDARSNRMARELAGRGLRAGDRLGVYLPNSIHLVDLYLACLKLGLIFVPINILYREREIAHIVQDAEPAATVGLEGGWQVEELARAAAQQPAEPTDAAPDPEAPAAIIYTSGTTGRSKGAVLTRANFAANAGNILEAWRITAEDRLLLALPLFHVHGLGNGLHGWLASGCRMRLVERFDQRTAAAEFLDFRPTLFFGVPTMYLRLLETPPEQARAIGAGMRLFVSGSAPLAPQVLEQFRALFGHTILERYGMTETLMNISNPYEGQRRPGSVGQPLPGVEIRLVEGEIYIRGPNVFAGYWRQPEATRAAFADGWFRSGDLATAAADGYYTLVGRRSDLIISGGFNIWPREIEEFLGEQPGVAEAAVIGAPDAARGEVPVAYIVPRGEFDAAALEAACRRSLASFKVPRAFLRVDSLPRTALGKVQKHLLPKS